MPEKARAGVQKSDRPRTPAMRHSAWVPTPGSTDEAGGARGDEGWEESGPVGSEGEEEELPRVPQCSRMAMCRAGTQLIAERGGWSKKSVSGCERNAA